MVIGLGLTGFVAFYVSHNMAILRVVASPAIQIGLFIGILIGTGLRRE